MPHPSTREAWLERSIDLLRPLYAQHGKPLPPRARVSIGFPNAKGKARDKVIGQIWHAAATADGIAQIFISPKLADPVECLAVLAHELAHLACGQGVGHKGPFVPLVRAIGLEGKPAATVAGEAFKQHALRVIAQLGPIPHAAITAGEEEREPKQSTRMIKCECPVCGYVARTSRRWIVEMGAPHCPKHGAMVSDFNPDSERE